MSLLEEDFETSIKVVVVGNGGVGKTSLIKKFCRGEFTEEYKKTIGVDFLEKDQFIPSIQNTVRLMLWDTAGQEEFDAVTRTYYRGAGAAVIAFSTIDRKSFDEIRKWKEKLERECGKLCTVLMQNKVDLIDQSVVSNEEAESLAEELGVKLFRTSVKNGLNVNNVFEHLAEMFVQENGGGQTDAVQSIGDLADNNTSNNDGMQRNNTLPFKLPSRVRTGGKKKNCCSV
eukprot:gb/GECH01003856.1/.p1 GENE.gb/GECH01003856.1/~~gb/GECH01003856.1/.p1  ORF type:complete len:229 (+),score=65.33 gb/GECH01003856.1/:1-687(+)